MARTLILVSSRIRMSKECCKEYHQQESVHHDIVDLQSEDEDTISVRLPLGTALVIPPQLGDYEKSRKKHWIVCRFTSSDFGKQVDFPAAFLNHTFAALQDLDMQLVSLRDGDDEQSMIDQLYSCRFNSGLFAVPWEQNWEVIDEVGLSMTVVYPEGRANIIRRKTKQKKENKNRRKLTNFRCNSTNYQTQIIFSRGDQIFSFCTASGELYPGVNRSVGKTISGLLSTLYNPQPEGV